MIEINLLPEALKAKKIGIGRIEARHLLYAMPLCLGVLLCAHLYLGIMGIISNSRLKALQNKWQALEPERKALEKYKQEYELPGTDVAMTRRALEERLNWSEKLNRISMNLPSGIWLNELSISSSGFILRGSAVSLTGQEVDLIKGFIDNLKNDTGFFKGFLGLELSSTVRKTIGSYEIIDFLLTGKLVTG